MNKFLLSASFVLAATFAPSYADDLTPPTWRGNAGTTVQHWDFSSGPTGTAPDAGPFNNPNGVPFLTAPNPTNWLSSFAGRNDVWALNGTDSLSFLVPNFNQPNHQKEVVVQITFWALAAFPPSIGSTLAGPGGLFTPISSSMTALGNDWFHEVTVWHTNVCPPFERLTISPPIPGVTSWVDQVVIDTRCYPIPTPGALALLGVAGVMSRRRRM